MFTCPACGWPIEPPWSIRSRFEAKVERSEGCWEWRGGRTGQGYGVFSAENRSELAHRQSWMLYRGPIPKGMYVLHTCDNTGCVNPDHLWIGTPLDNMQDKTAKGRGRYLPSYVKGSQHGMAKLSDDEVRQMRRLRNEGRKLVDIATAFGISKSSAGRICSGKSWRHLH